MTRRVNLPTIEQVQTAIQDISGHGSDSPLTVRRLAQHLGLSNSTFWRHFPEIAQSVADKRRQLTRTATASRPVDQRGRDETEARLRERVAELAALVAASAAQVQRLTLENRVLREHLQTESSIVHIRER
jgi:AcrR family transcriptional regulator